MDLEATRQQGESVMGKVESLLKIRECWNNADLSLYEKASIVAEEYYSTSLKLDATSAYIGATPSELDSLLALSELDDELLQKVSDANPPITTWMIIANASDEEIIAAIEEMSGGRNRRKPDDVDSIEERLFSAMIQVGGPTQEQVLSTLPYEVIGSMVKRAEAYKALTPRNLKALKGFASWRRRGKTLTEKQTSYLKSILSQLVEAKAIEREGIDKDQEYCDIVLNALEM